MNRDLKEKNLDIECNCCIKKNDIIICSYKNCDYPLCEQCMNRILETNNLCPSCRREINIINRDLERITNNEDNFDENINIINNILILMSYFWWYIINKLIYINTQIRCDNIFYIIFWSCIFCIIFIILTFVGRIITFIFMLGPIDFFCYSTGMMYILFYLLWSVLGLLILFILFIIILFFICLFFNLIIENR
jgi:hypothetical protein